MNLTDSLGLFSNGVFDPPPEVDPEYNAANGYNFHYAISENEPRKPEQKTASIPNDLRARLRKLLQKAECGDFVKNLIDEVARETGKTSVSDSVLDLFDKIDGPGGGGYVLSPEPLELHEEGSGLTLLTFEGARPSFQACKYQQTEA